MDINTIPDVVAPLGVAHVAGFEDIPLPRYAHDGDAGMDLCSGEEVLIDPGGRITVRTGLRFSIPPGYRISIVPRSGLAARHGLTIVNSPGTVDAGYTGEVRVVLLNTDRRMSLRILRGDKIAQAILEPTTRAAVFTMTAAELDAVASSREADGFGSTGGHATLTPGGPQ